MFLSNSWNSYDSLIPHVRRLKAKGNINTKRSQSLIPSKLQPYVALSAQIQCESISRSLAEYEEGMANLYTAISYVWRNPNYSRTILVDGKPLDVMVALYSALRHVRPKDGAARLWKDAICINQSDTDERNKHLRQMGSIYACADHTIIFNSSTAEDELLLDTVRTYNNW